MFESAIRCCDNLLQGMQDLSATISLLCTERTGNEPLVRPIRTALQSELNVRLGLQRAEYYNF